MVDEEDTTRQGPADEGSGVHRLRDILVEEVSLVDRAANKRRFLVVKRSGEVPQDGKRGRPRKAGKPPGVAAGRSRAKKKPKVKPGQAIDKARRRAASGGDDQDETEKVDDEEEDDEETEKADDEEEEEEDEAEKADDDDDEEDD